MMGNAIFLMAECALLTLTGYVQKINAAEWLAWHVKMPFRRVGGSDDCHPSLEKG